MAGFPLNPLECCGKRWIRIPDHSQDHPGQVSFVFHVHACGVCALYLHDQFPNML